MFALQQSHPLRSHLHQLCEMLIKHTHLERHAIQLTQLHVFSLPGSSEITYFKAPGTTQIYISELYSSSLSTQHCLDCMCFVHGFMSWCHRGWHVVRLRWVNEHCVQEGGKQCFFFHVRHQDSVLQNITYIPETQHCLELSLQETTGTTKGQ